ncbi:MAG TPA: thymidine phosphorylase [Pyrinomonadaceae bacterium]|nr:thymidine phosphorylase [Pyrinomonadaceae bacterium]HMP66938.1 thymidine phosphorylase [Pyrinomonadaceae bacterium]
MRPQEVIAVKRDGAALSREQIDTFIEGVCDGTWTDYQISAMLMAMFTRGLSEDEQSALTYAMLHSGEVLDLSDIARPKADKHSTGGVGDKTSLVIAPVLAACGVAVPMISGRGLGHTGGTLDKLESIPGYNVDLSTSEFRAVVEKCGFAMSGQTADIAPADKKLYALRDATATVPYMPLIVASIMSKKLAEGLDALILDVKTGNGAFMSSREDSAELARALVATGKNFGLQTQALVTDMSQPLGRYVGNDLETFECLQILRNETPPGAGTTRELSKELCARLLVLAGQAEDVTTAEDMVESKLSGGGAFETFVRNCELQGGDVAVCEEPARLLKAGLYRHEIVADRAGFVAAAEALAIGGSVVTIGGGRQRAEDRIDHSVGFECHAKVGDEVESGDLLGVLICRNEQQAGAVSEKLGAAYKISEHPVEPPKLVHEIV